jgi:hypothetical protein
MAGIALPTRLPYSTQVLNSHLVLRVERVAILEIRYKKIRTALPTFFITSVTLPAIGLTGSIAGSQMSGIYLGGEARNRTRSSPTTSLNTLIFKGILRPVLQDFKLLLPLHDTHTITTRLLKKSLKV